jgi:hypothetical protein
MCSVQSRDLFGLTELPIRNVFLYHPDPKTAAKWKKYLETRRHAGACRDDEGMRNSWQISLKS